MGVDFCVVIIALLVCDSCKIVNGYIFSTNQGCPSPMDGVSICDAETIDLLERTLSRRCIEDLDAYDLADVLSTAINANSSLANFAVLLIFGEGEHLDMGFHSSSTMPVATVCYAHGQTSWRRQFTILLANLAQLGLKIKRPLAESISGDGGCQNNAVGTVVSTEVIGGSRLSSEFLARRITERLSSSANWAVLVVRDRRNNFLTHYNDYHFCLRELYHFADGRPHAYIVMTLRFN